MWIRAAITALSLFAAACSTAHLSSVPEQLSQARRAPASTHVLSPATSAGPAQGWYFIQNAGSFNYLDSNTGCGNNQTVGCDVLLWQFQGGVPPQQTWFVSPILGASNYYTIVDDYRGELLDGDLSHYQGNGTQVITYSFSGREIQDWIFELVAYHNWYRIHNRVYTDMCLDGRLPGGNGSHVQLYGCNTLRIQQWELLPAPV